MPMQIGSIRATLDEKVLNDIHNLTVDILSRRGFRFSWPDAVEVFKLHGFKVDNDIVFFSGTQIETALESVPSEVTILARDPQHNLKLDLDTTAFGLGRGAIYTIDKHGRHRKSTLSDLIQVSKLAQRLPEVQHWQPLVLPNDLPDQYISMGITRTMLTYQSKPDIIHGDKQLSQLINPGCPILYGNMGSGSEMRTMGGSFGSPESRLIEFIAGKLAKYYGLLSRGGTGMTDSEYMGFQAGAEALLQAQNALACGSNLVIGMGIMGGLMGASLSKIILDAELVNYARSYHRNS